MRAGLALGPLRRTGRPLRYCLCEKNLTCCACATPPHAIAIDHRWGKALTTVSAALTLWNRIGRRPQLVERKADGIATAVDACLVFHGTQCDALASLK